MTRQPCSAEKSYPTRPYHSACAHGEDHSFERHEKYPRRGGVVCRRLPGTALRPRRYEMEYTILLHPDVEQGGYWVTVPALPGCVSQGDAREAIRLHIAGMIEDGESVPEETAHFQAVVIDVAA